MPERKTYQTTWVSRLDESSVKESLSWRSDYKALYKWITRDIKTKENVAPSTTSSNAPNVSSNPQKTQSSGENTTTNSEDKNSVEYRLKKIKVLYDKGLLTKEEYDKKREEIIESL